MRGEFAQAYYPSKRSLALCAVMTIALLVPPIAIDLGSCTTQPSATGAGTSTGRIDRGIVATVHAGLGAVVFPIVIFVAGFAVGTASLAGIPRSEVLLKASYLFPLSFFAIASAMVFLVPGLYATLLWTELILIIGSIFAFHHIILLSLDERRLFESGVALLSDVIRRNIKAGFDERIGNNSILASLNEPDSLITYDLLIRESRLSQSYVAVRSSTHGTITQIDLHKLNRTLEKAARSSLAMPDVTYVPGHGLQLNGLHFMSLDTTDQQKAQLLKLIGNTVAPDDAELVRVPRTWFSGVQGSELLGSIEHCFRIAAVQSRAEDLKFALTNLKDSAIAAIRDKRTGSLERISSIYVRLGSEFLHELQTRGRGFTLAEARAEESIFFGGWADVTWLRDDCRDLLAFSLQGGDRHVVEAVLHIPRKLILQAIEHNDLYIFNTFRSYPLRLYETFTKTTDQEYRRYLLDQSHRYLSEVCNYVVSMRLRATTQRPIKPEVLFEFAIAALLTFQDLLVEAANVGDVNSFRTFYESVQNLRPWARAYDELPSVAPAGMHLNHSISVENELEAQRTCELRKERAEQEKYFNERRNQMLLGVGSMVFGRLSMRREDTSLKESYQVASAGLPSKIPDLLSLFANCNDDEVREFWNWLPWYLPVGQGGPFDSFGAFQQMLAFELLQRVRSCGVERIRSLECHDRGSKHFLCSLPDFQSTIDSSLEFARQVGVELPTAEQVKALRETLLQFRKDISREEEDRAIASTPSAETMRWFGEGVLQGFKGEASVRQILQLHSAFDTELDASSLTVTDGGERFGLSQLAGKKGLLHDPERAYTALGVNFGSSVGTGENKYLLAQLVKGIAVVDELEEIGAENSVDEAIAELRASGGSQLVLIVVSCFSLLEHWRAQKHFQEPHAGDTRGPSPLAGYYGESRIPTYHVYQQQLARRVLVLDLKRFAKLTQHKVMSDENKASSIEHFLVSMHDLNTDDDLRRRIQEQSPQVVNGQQDPERYLRGAILVQVFERFSLSILDPSRGRSFSIPPWRESS